MATTKTLIRDSTDVQDPAPIAATVDLLRAETGLYFDATHLLLVAAPTPPPAAAASYLYRLAKAAQDAAYARACSSILAGEGSESDDTGDVALWLGDGEYGTPAAVVGALGLRAGQAEAVRDSCTLENVEQLASRFSFRVEGADSRVYFFLVGQIGGGWGGLAGVGTWS